jgi:hypothetical protein
MLSSLLYLLACSQSVSMQYLSLWPSVANQRTMWKWLFSLHHIDQWENRRIATTTGGKIDWACAKSARVFSGHQLFRWPQNDISSKLIAAGKMCKELPNGSAGGESGLVYVHVKHVAHVSSIKMMKEFIWHLLVVIFRPLVTVMMPIETSQK